MSILTSLFSLLFRFHSTVFLLSYYFSYLALHFLEWYAFAREDRCGSKSSWAMVHFLFDLVGRGHLWWRWTETLQRIPAKFDGTGECSYTFLTLSMSSVLSILLQLESLLHTIAMSSGHLPSQLPWLKEAWCDLPWTSVLSHVWIVKTSN